METRWGVVYSSWPVPCSHRPLSLLNPLSFPLRPIQCTCSSVKGPLAVLQVAHLSTPPRLRIYSSLLREDDTVRNQPNYGGVPHVLLDYLITTSLVLVTDIEEYLHRSDEGVGAAKSAMEAFLPSALRNRSSGSGRGSYASTESRSPGHSTEDVSTPDNNATPADDARSVNSEPISTPTSTISQYHPYSFFHFAADVPPVPEVPPEHQSSVPPIPPRSSTLPPLPTVGRTPTVRRRLPQPPGQATPITPARTEQFWGHPNARSTPDLTLPADSSDPMSLPPPLPTPPQHLQQQQRLHQTSQRSRSSMSISRRPLPPQRQPPQLPVPLPPKLRDDLTRQIPPSAASSDGLSSAGEIPGQVHEPGSSIHEGGGSAGGVQPQEFHRRFSNTENPPTVRASVYELPPPAYDAIDFSIPRPPAFSGEGYQSFSVNSRLPPEQIS